MNTNANKWYFWSFVKNALNICTRRMLGQPHNGSESAKNMWITLINLWKTVTNPTCLIAVPYVFSSILSLPPLIQLGCYIMVVTKSVLSLKQKTRLDTYQSWARKVFVHVLVNYFAVFASVSSIEPADTLCILQSPCYLALSRSLQHLSSFISWSLLGLVSDYWDVNVLSGIFST